jgi:4-diphosphocytidyl-2C-methyl-D-erythritol kinase
MQLVHAFRRGDVPAISRLLYNGLTAAALALEPGLARLAELLERASGTRAVMSGSGSSFFCLCRTAREARRGAAYMKSMGFASSLATASYG